MTRTWDDDDHDEWRDPHPWWHSVVLVIAVWTPLVVIGMSCDALDDCDTRRGEVCE